MSASPASWSVPLGWDRDPTPPPESLLTALAGIYAAEPLTPSDPPTPPFFASGAFTSSSSSISQSSSQEASWSLDLQDPLQSDTDSFWSQWINDGVKDLEMSQPSPVDVEMHEVTARFPELLPEPVTQDTFELAAAPASSSIPVWCPPASRIPEFNAHLYAAPLTISEIPVSSCPPIIPHQQDAQTHPHLLYPSSPPPVHVTPSAAILPVYSTPWSSRGFPRSRTTRDTSTQGRTSQTPFLPLSPRARYMSRSFSPCPWPSGLVSPRSPTLHYAGISRRAYSSASPPSPALKRKRASSSDKEEKKPPPPKRSELHPPKQAPSVWQIFFTDWLEQKKSLGDADQKLNVAQAAKEAGQQYNKITDEKREELKQRALVLKDKYERESAAWKRTLTPEDIARENAFRAAQRKSGKSRRKNLNDPNAPKRPLSAYFLFLQRIRGDPVLVKEVFGAETETTRQSVLAAAKWRSMSDTEKKPYFDQAEDAKLEYEAERKAYEDQTRENEYVSSVTSVMIYPTSSGRNDGSGDNGGVLSASGGGDR